MNSFGPNGPGLERASNAIHVLLNHYQDILVPAFTQLEDPEEHFVRAALLVRSPPLVEAALQLAEAGFGRETMMLNRPLFELMVDAYWAQAEPALADELFLAHARYTQHLQREVARRYPGVFGAPKEESLPAEELEESMSRFGRYASRSWTGMNLHQRVEFFETYLADQGEAGRHRLWFVFDVLHDLNNSELHPSSWSLGRALRRLPSEEGGGLQFRLGPEPELATFALSSTWWVLVQTLDLMHELCGVPNDSLQEAAEAGAELLGLAEPD